MNRRDLIATFLSADNEHQLQKKLFELSIKTDKMPHVISIYTRGSKIVAWLFVELKHLSNVVESDIITEDKTIKKAKKKVKKKVKKKEDKK